MSLTEEAVGMAPVQAQVIECVFRERYSDFVVREVGPDGAVARVVAEAPPADAPDEAPAEEEAPATAAGLAALAGGGADVVEAIERVLSGADPGPAALPPCSDKAARTAQHQYARRLGAATDTDGAGPAMHVRVWKAGGSRKRARDGGGRQDSRNVWPAGRPRFCRFALYKENCDTMAVVGALARALRCKASSVGYAGTKDRRAATTQFATAHRKDARTVSAAVARVARQFPAVRCGGFSYVGDALRLGDLSGNAFEVALRRARVAGGGREALVAAAADAARRVGERGFVNYFGLQRFGTGATSNAIVGEAVLKAATGRGEWKAVSDLILGARARDEPREVEAKAHYAAGRLREAVDAMPRRQRVERGLLEGLVRHGANAHLSAFETLPKNLRLMYVHAWRPGVLLLLSFGASRLVRTSTCRLWGLRTARQGHALRGVSGVHGRGTDGDISIEQDSEFTVITTLGTSRASSTRPRPRGRRGTASPSWPGTWCSSAAARVGGSPRTRPCASSARRTWARTRSTTSCCRCRGTP